MRVMIAGIAGASLGTELLKCLQHAGGYEAHGCDVSPYAYGHYIGGFRTTHRVDPNRYIDDVMRICSEQRIEAILPGGEQPLQLISDAADRFGKLGIKVASNSRDVVRICTDKLETFARLKALGFEIPVTRTVERESDLDGVPTPCVIKPARGSGGSVFVFLAADREQAWLCARYLVGHGMQPVAQEYLDHAEGEYSLGILSLPGHGVVASIAMQRRFDAKLSVQVRSKVGIISSPYGQGLIDHFPAVTEAGRTIAAAIDSQGPLNVQGRVRRGKFIPFEINPRFSGSEYLRTLAGVNQPHLVLQYLKSGTTARLGPLKRGYYLRGLSETYARPEDLRT
jgi:carbamoyl-phosphate synthase large subunit